MKAQELRKGDYIISQGREVVFEESFNGKINPYWLEDEVEGYGNIDDAEGIPLTEEWLLRLGFESTDIWGDHSKGDILIMSNEGARYWIEHGKVNKKTFIQYVHQLQNLYFALTGEELTIKQS